MKNPIRFAWKTITKSLVYFFFVLGSLILITAVYPTILLFVHPVKKSGRAMRFATYLTFRVMGVVMWGLGLVKVDIDREDRKKLGKLRSTIVVANHPSLIDICILLGFLPQADCIVNAALFKKPVVRFVVKRLFVPNSMDFGQLLASCDESLKDGNCLVIFPEGSRTKPGITSVIHKGSARIALGTGRQIMPIHIEANDMRGLRKGDPFYRISEKGRYQFKFILGEPLSPSDYEGMPIQIAARKLNEDIRDRIFPGGQKT